MINVLTFCFLCTEPGLAEIAIYDLNPDVNAEVFRGCMRDVGKTQYNLYEVCSYDLTDEGLTLNIDTSEQ